MRRVLLILLVVTLLVVALGACGRRGRGGGGEARQPAITAGPGGQGVAGAHAPLERAPALATLHGNGLATPEAIARSDHHGETLRVDVIALQRTTPETVTARFRITNEGSEPTSPALDDTISPGYDDDLGTFSGVGLLSAQQGLVSLPMYDEQRDNACLCTTVHAWAMDEVQLERGGPPVFAYAVYWLPPQLGSVQVVSRPLGELTAPLPISGPDPAAPQVANEPSPELITTATRHTFQVERRVVGPVQRETDRDNQVRIELSTDVLFAFDKADLSSAAQAELRRVADRLAEATGTVRVVGHTDDVGSDAYNLDLSRRRAQAVHQALAGMVTGERVRFQVEGKGETQPAVPGTSAGARRRNRRVEISFERLAVPPAPSTTTPPTSQPAQPASGRPLGSAQGTGEWAGVTLEVLQARRVGSDMAAVSVRLTNNGSGQPLLNQWETMAHSGAQAGFEGKLYDNGDFFWMLATDGSATRYYVVTTADSLTEPCICSVIHFVPSDRLPPGHQVRLFALLAVPPEASTVNLEVASFSGPIRNLPLG